MADSREKLQQAIAAKKGQARPAPPAPRKPAKKAPAKPAPPPPREPVSRAPAKKAAAEAPTKPASSKAFSLFKKSKKTDKSKEKPKKPKKPKKAPRPEQKKTGPDEGSFLKKFAQHVVDELKEATEEIKPKALLNTAAESIQTLKSIVKSDEPSPSGEPDAFDAAEDDLPEADRSSAAGEPSSTLEPPAVGGESASPAQAPDRAGGPPADFSPAKVQRAPQKRQQPEPEIEDREAELHEGTDEAPQEAQPESAMADASPAAAEADAPSTQADFSAAKVQRHTPKKQKTESLDDEDFPEPEDTPPDAEEGVDQPDSEAQEEDDRVQTEDKEDEGPDLDLEDESPAEEDGPEAPVASEEQAALKEKKPQKEKKGKSQKKKKPQQKQAPPPLKLSKAEQALRSFHALQVILNNTTWSSVVLDSDSRPSTLYSPRERFDTQFSDTVFREGLKAAGRLATSYAFEPEKILFNEQVIEAVRKFSLDPEGRIKKDDDLLSKVLDEETVKAALNLYKKPPVRHLLFSVATRVGIFVPTIEILARIYLGLRKKTDINPGQRLMIQDEVLLRYKKSVYTETKASKARNLALNYFTDYLSEHGMKIYKDRFASAPEGQDNIEAHYRRHEIIKTHCFNIFEEWGTRVGLSSHGLINLKARFSETADLFIKEEVGENPNPPNESA